jgi:ankyrin repeat protein
MNSPLPPRTLPERPDLDQLKRQAKELLVELREREPNSDHALHDAQLLLARSYGFGSWPKLKAFVEGVTERRLADAIRAGNTTRVRTMLEARPELARRGQMMHLAVLGRMPEMVRLLMEHGANAREGVYPHRDATTPLVIASERGYDEIVAIIREVEANRRQGAPAPDDLFRSIASGEETRAIALMETDQALIHSRDPQRAFTPLHVAARHLNAPLVERMLARGADPVARGLFEFTPVDLAAHFSDAADVEALVAVSKLLPMTDRAAVALGHVEWLRARHAEGILVNRIVDSGGLLRIACSHNRPEILKLLLDFGFDPNERTHFGESDEGTDFTQGMPLWHCAGTAKYELAEMLLQHGANPNAMVYASGDPMFQAYSQQDWKMVELLERYGGKPMATSAGLYRRTDLARRMLSGEAPYLLDGVGGGTLAEQLLWGAACGGDPEIVRMALESVDWPRDDPRWFHILEQPLRVWSHGSGSADWDRGTYLTCFRLLLERADPNIIGRLEEQAQLGMTILHSVAGAREHVTAEERVAFATMLLDAGARLDVRDKLLRSTALGWACRWGRIELVKLLLDRGADPAEADAEPWATPIAWAEKRGHSEIAAMLRAATAPYSEP